MITRGAMAIGVSGAMGVAIGIQNSTATDIPTLNAEVAEICAHLAATRPTAVNLFWGIDRVRALYDKLAATNTPIPEIKKAVVALSQEMYDEDIANCKQLGANGADLLPQEGTILTHCNAGALAACGTAPPSASSAPPSSRATSSTSSPMRPAPTFRARASRRGSS